MLLCTRMRKGRHVGMDIKTLVLCNLAVNLVNVCGLAIVWLQNRRVFSGLQYLLADMVLQAAGFLLILHRGALPDLLTVVVPNLFFIIGALSVLHGLERFFGAGSGHVLHSVLMALYTAALVYTGLIRPNLALREMFISLMIMLVTAQIAWLLCRRIQHSFRKMARFTGLVFIAYAAVSLIRVVLLTAFPPQASDFFKSHALDAAFIAAYLCLSVLVSMSLILLINRRLLEEVQFQKMKYQILFHQVPYAILLTKMADGEIIEVNEGFEQLSGYTKDEALGHTTIGLNIWLREQDRSAVVDELTKGNRIHEHKIQFRHKNGQHLTGLMSSSVVYIKDEACMLTTVSDITQQSQMNERLHELAMHDWLTGLPNRSLFFDRFEQASATALREGKKMAIMSMDLDAFKAINDDYGHPIGDRVLIEVGKRLSGLLRKGDTVARFGGDEFIFLIWDVPSKQALIRLIDRLMSSFLPPVEIDTRSIPVSISAGVAMFPDDETDINALIKKSDEAMYRVKETGRKNYAMYQAGGGRR